MNKVLILCISGFMMLPADPVEKILTSLTLDQKIGQLFMVPTASLEKKSNEAVETLAAASGYKNPYTIDHAYIEMLIKGYHIGGLIFLYKNSPEAQRACIEKFNALSALPLLIGQDCEWGPAMRHSDIIKFPRNLTLGAIQDDQLLYEFGLAIGKLCRDVGVHINFAPVVDVNNNPENPVIHDRSFGDNPERVTRCAQLVMRGMHDAGIISCIKHFPGHGDTAVDSHKDLPLIPHTLERLEAVELKPFKELIQKGAPALMMAHLLVPALDPEYPASLSQKTIQYLRNEGKFDGLIVTDGLGMQGILQGTEPGEVECDALCAGNDLLVCPVNVPKAVEKIKEALGDGRLSLDALEAHVRKVIGAKLKAGLFSPAPKSVQSSDYAPLKKKLYAEAIAWIDEPCSLENFANAKATGTVLFGFQSTNMQEMMRNAGYAVLQPHEVEDNSYTSLMIGIAGLNKFHANNYGVSSEVLDCLRKAKAAGKNILPVLFGTPYAANILKEESMLCAFEDDADACEAVVNILAGKQEVKGILPVQIM